MLTITNDIDLVNLGKSLIMMVKYYFILNNIRIITNDYYMTNFDINIKNEKDKLFLKVIIDSFNQLNNDEREVIYNKLFHLNDSVIGIAYKINTSKSTLYRKYNRGLKKLAQLFLKRYH